MGVVDILLYRDAVPYLGAAAGVVGGLGLLTSLVARAEAELVRSGFVVCSLVETALVTDLGGRRKERKRKGKGKKRKKGKRRREAISEMKKRVIL